MKALRILRALSSALVLSLVLCLSAQAQPVLVTNAPATGTFFLLGANPPLPFPFDPYFGVLPIFSYDGVFFVDDSQVGDLLLQQDGFGGGMSMNSLSGPGPGITGTNGGIIDLFHGCPTNFALSYQYSTNALSIGIAQTTNPWIPLTIQTSTTNASYDLFLTTNLIELASPALSRTNWVWLTRATGGETNFSWGQTNWCERYFQLGTLWDDDLDGLTTAYETLSSHTDPNLWDTDGDLIGDGIEVLFGLNPRVSDPPFTISITQPTPNLLP